MNYTKNDNSETIVAYTISEVILTELKNISITLPDAKKAVGLYPEQTADYTPMVGDFYIDAGDIKESSVMAAADFNKIYKQDE